MSASAMVGSKDDPVPPPSTQREQAVPPPWPRPYAARAAPCCRFFQQNHQRTTHAACKRPSCSHPQRHSVRSFLACPQHRACEIDQISIGRTRGPRFRASKVSATPPEPQCRASTTLRGVAETSPICEARTDDCFGSSEEVQLLWVCRSDSLRTQWALGEGQVAPSYTLA
jgi:hypothetical protein